MPKITMEEAPEYLTLEDDTIIGVRVDSHRIEEKDGRNGKWQKIEFKFTVTSVPDAAYEVLVGSPIWGGIPFRFNDSEDNPLKRWAEALLGMELSTGFELDTDYLNGREARAVIRTYEKRTGGRNHAVDDLLPKGAPAAASQPFGGVVGMSPPQGGWSQPPPQQPAAPPAQPPAAPQPAAQLVEDEIPF